MRLRNVERADVDLYVRMRCDPVMMAELGGPLPRAGIEAKVLRDVAAAESDESWILMIECDELPGVPVAGSVVLWSSEHDGESFTEVGWMVLPEFQGRGIAKRAVRTALERARDAGRWGVVHAFPGVTNGPSNGICRSLGFRLLGTKDARFADRVLQTNHWQINPRTDLAGASAGQAVIET